MGFVSDLAAVDAAVAGYFDEARFQVLPFTSGAAVNGVRVRDKAREPYEFAGTLDLGAPALQGSAQSPRGNAALPSGGSGVSHHGVITALSTGWPYLPTRDDQIVPVTPTGDRLVVATVQQDGTARLAIYVNKARAT